MIDTSDAIFYREFASQSPAAEMPPQALPDSQKTEKWKRANADALERIGIRQFSENLKFNDFYRMVEGKMSYTELSEVMPQLREVEKTLDDFEIPSYLKHYDLIGIIVNALAGELIQHSDKFHVVNVDEIATNEYLRTRNELVNKYIKEEFNKELTFRLIQRGLDPFKDKFKSEEEKMQYMQFLDQNRQELTPPQIQQYMNSEWKPNAVRWGEHTLEADREKFKMDSMDRQEFIDYLLTGRCFRHYRVGYDYYKPERWNPLNTFFSQDLEIEEAENSEYIGRVHFYTPSQVINRYPDKITEVQKRTMLSRNRVISETGGVGMESDMSYKQLFESNFSEKKLVPFQNFFDYEFNIGLEDTFNIPLAQKTIVNKDGTTTTVPSWIPRLRDDRSLSSKYAKFLREDLNLRSDLIQVTEAYFLSHKRIGRLTYETPTGRLETITVTDDLLPEILQENQISRLRTVTLEEVMKKPQAGTIVYDYIPEWWQVLKVSADNLYLDTPIYDVRPMEYQIKGNSNVYDVKPPVVGIIQNTSLANKLQPWQVPYNVVNNQIFNLLEKEIGLFFMFDINFLPSEYKEWGDSEEALIHLRNIAKNVGVMPIDASKGNTQNSAFNQFMRQDITFSTQLADRQGLAEYFKAKAFEQIGVTPQRIGTPVKYETAEGVKQGLNASYSQTEAYFQPFFDYKTRALETHLTVAQYSQTNEKDITVFYTKSDATKVFLQFSDDDFHLRKFGILPVSNSKKRKDLETFKSILFNMNTLGSDELALAELVASDTMSEAIAVARQARIRRDEEAMKAQQNAIQQIQSKAEAEDALKQKEWERQELSNERDRKNKIDVKRIDALGRALDNNADPNSLEQINREADYALKKESQEADIDLKRRESDRKDKELSESKKLEWAKLNLEFQKLYQQQENNRSNEFQSIINKN